MSIKKIEKPARMDCAISWNKQNEIIDAVNALIELSEAKNGKEKGTEAGADSGAGKGKPAVKKG